MSESFLRSYADDLVYIFFYFLLVGKSPAETAVEEIEEEVGYRVNVEALKFVSSFRSGVGVSGSLQHLFFCEVR